jgi:toxin ParE1/3/4
MTEKVRWTPAAFADFEAIADFIGVEQMRPYTAVGVLEGIVAKCDYYADNPMLGMPYPSLGLECRLFRFKRYLIFYRPISTGIELLRIIDGARDFEEVLGRLP